MDQSQHFLYEHADAVVAMLCFLQTYTQKSHVKYILLEYPIK